ncbi:MAG: F0F1 ATP synthase subunit epsilon, partial [Candidatus Pacebacteria bacterium]|nr:F0F1 ATP synthase subunit epsilon [Candidatus Paceibacterota bacterium]
MRTFHLTVARVGENLFDGEAVSVTVPGKDGVFQILAGHEALVSELRAGAVQVKTADEQMHRFDVPQGGIAEISQGQAT